MSAERKAWADGVRRLSNEACGVVELQVIEIQDVPELLAYAILGDPEAARLARLASETLRKIQKAPPGKPVLCASCPKPLRRGRYSLVSVTPRRDTPTQALMLAVCRDCGTDRTSIVLAANQGLRRLWPGARLLGDIHPVEGRA